MGAPSSVSSSHLCPVVFACRSVLPPSLLLAGTAPSVSPLSNRASAHPKLFSFLPTRLLFFFSRSPCEPGLFSGDLANQRPGTVWLAKQARPQTTHWRIHGGPLGATSGSHLEEPLAGQRQAGGRRATGTEQQALGNGHWAGASVCGTKSACRVIQPPSQDLPQMSEDVIRAQNLLRSSRFSSHDTGIPNLHHPLVTHAARGSICHRPAIFAARSPV